MGRLLLWWGVGGPSRRETFSRRVPTAALSDLGCGIIAATVKTTEEGAANNRFVVAAPDGCGPEKIKAALLRIAE